MSNSFWFYFNNWVILRFVIPLNKLVHILILSKYLLNFYFIILLTINKRHILTSEIYQTENINWLLLWLWLIITIWCPSFLRRMLNILTLIYPIIPLITLHLRNKDMKLCNKLLILLCLEYRIDMKVPILLTKVLLSKSNQQPKVIIINGKV